MYITVALSIFTLCNHHPPSPELFLSSQTESLYPLSNNSLFPFSPSPGDNHSTSCFYEFNYSTHLI